MSYALFVVVVAKRNCIGDYLLTYEDDCLTRKSYVQSLT